MHAETRRTDWHDFGDYGRAAYRIWLRRTPFGTLQQRHEWRTFDGGTFCEDWIDTPARDFPANASPVALRDAFAASLASTEEAR